MFYKHFRYYIVLFIVFGIWSTWENYRYKWKLRIYSNLLIVTVFCAYLSAVFMNQFFGSLSVSTSVATINFITILLTHLVIAIETPFKTSIQNILLKKLSFIDQLFKRKLNISMKYPEQKRSLFCMNFVMVSVTLCIEGGILIYVFSQPETYNFFLSSVYSCWIIRLRLIQIIFFAYILQARLCLINTELAYLKDESNSFSPGNSIVDIENPDIKRKMFNRFIALKQCYGELYEVCTLINAIFGYSLLAIVTQHWIDFTANCYWLFEVDDGSTFDYETLVICLMLVLPNVMVLGALAYFCSACSTQVRNYL